MNHKILFKVYNLGLVVMAYAFNLSTQRQRPEFEVTPPDPPASDLLPVGISLLWTFVTGLWPCDSVMSFEIGLHLAFVSVPSCLLMAE